MNCYYLDIDEVDYELSIRNLKGLGEETDKRRELRRCLRSEGEDVDLVPHTTALNADDEYRVCVEKVRALVAIYEAEKRNFSKLWELQSRLIHVDYRICRIVKEEITISIPFISFEELRVSCRTLKNEVDSLLTSKNKPKEGNKTKHYEKSSTPIPVSDPNQRFDEGAGPSNADAHRSKAESDLQIANEVIKTLMGNLEIQKRNTGSNLCLNLPRFQPEDDSSSSESRSGRSEDSRRSARLMFDRRGRNRSPEVRRERYRSPVRRENVSRGMRVSGWNLTFSGDSNGRTLSDFLNKVEHLRKAENVSREQLFRSSYHLFAGVALDWFIAFSEKFKSWDELVAALKKQFLPHDYDYWLLKDIEKRLQLSSESFGIYLANMELMFKNLPRVLPEIEKVNILRRNILPTYQERLALIDITTVSQLFDLCSKIEASVFQVSRRNNVSFAEAANQGPQRNITRSSSPVPQKALYVPPQQRQRNHSNDREVLVRCYNCLEEGHIFNTCLQPRRLFCFRCGKQGVTTPDCSRCATISNVKGNQ